MRALLVVALVACGGPKKVTPAPVATPPPALPACALDKDVLPAGGKLACRELPLSIAFPDGIKVTRQTDGALTLYSAELDRGVMALLVEPRLEPPDATRLGMLIESLIKGIRANADTVTIEARPLAGATVTVGLKFTTPDGGEGVAHGYYANHFIFAAIVGGTSPESKPSTPRATAFLASLALHPLASGTKRYDLAGGAYVNIPATAWPTGTSPAQDGVRSDVLHLVPDRKVWIGIRELEMRDRCETLKGTAPNTSSDLGERLRSIYPNAQHPITNIEPGTHGDFSAFGHADAGATHVVMYLICAGKTLLQLTVAGKAPNAELRPHLDEVARSLVGAK